MRYLIKYRMRDEEALCVYEFSDDRIELDGVIERFIRHLAPAEIKNLPTMSDHQKQDFLSGGEHVMEALSYIKNECRVQAWFYKKLDG